MFLMQPTIERYEDYLRLAEENGFGFEIVDFMYPDVLDDENTVQERLKLYSDAPVVSLHGPFIDLNYSGGDNKVFDISRDRIKKCSEYCVRLGAKKMVIHSCFFPVSPKNDPLYDNWCAVASKFFDEVTKEYGITLCIENVLDRDPDIIKKMLETSGNERVRVCLDIGHANFSMTGIDGWMAALGDYAVHYHLHDNMGYYDEHLAAGRGTVEWKRFFGLRKRCSTESDMVLEVATPESIKESYEFIKNYEY